VNGPVRWVGSPPRTRPTARAVDLFRRALTAKGAELDSLDAELHVELRLRPWHASVLDVHDLWPDWERVADLRRQLEAPLAERG
jgi:hypothetical protein